jgi:hypothetical protein
LTPGARIRYRASCRLPWRTEDGDGRGSAVPGEGKEKGTMAAKKNGKKGKKKGCCCGGK